MVAVQLLGCFGVVSTVYRVFWVAVVGYCAVAVLVGCKRVLGGFD